MSTPNINFYNAEQIEQLLKNLNRLQEVIEHASSVYLKLGKDGYSQKLSNDWDNFFRQNAKPEQTDKRLCLLYLANDILQKCRTSGCEQYLDSFKPILMECFKSMIDLKNEKLRKESLNILEIWRERKVFTKEKIKEMQNALTYDTTDMPSKKILGEGVENVKQQDLPDDLIAMPQDLITYTESVNNLKKWCEKTKDAENKLSKMLLNGEIAFNEDEANLNLSEYKRCLELQQKYRTSLLKALLELIRQSDTDNVKYTHMMKKVVVLMDELDKLKI